MSKRGRSAWPRLVDYFFASFSELIDFVSAPRRLVCSCFRFWRFAVLSDSCCSFDERSPHGSLDRPPAACPSNYYFLFVWSQKEEKRYNYDEPGMTSKTSRFTNNVWKLTTDVGFGMGKAKYKGVMTYFVVAFFFPKGNEPSDFARNVLRKGSVSSVVTVYRCTPGTWYQCAMSYIPRTEFVLSQFVLERGNRISSFTTSGTSRRNRKIDGKILFYSWTR